MARVQHRSPAKPALLALAASVVVLAAGSAEAQQQTFHLDRLEVPGAPDDGAVMFRPVTQPNAIFYGQLGVGLALDPLRTSNITNDISAIRASSTNVVTTQFSTYLSAGFELLDSLTLGATFPVAWGESGNTPVYPDSAFGGPANTAFTTNGPAVGDTRLDVRYVLARSADRTKALGIQLSVWVPTGAGSSTNFGGDGGVDWMPMVTGEWNPKHNWPIFIANTGFDFRPDNSINDPAGNHGPAGNGLGIGAEWRWALGAMLPLKGDKYRLGVNVFGQTGLQGSGNQTTGNTFFTARNTPVEWSAEGRMKLPMMLGWDKWFVGATAGTLILDGYGAPDLRIVALFGSYVPITDTNASSPEPRAKLHRDIRESMKDTDGDGIPDDIDACPTEPEDHKDPDPMDGCPALADRDGDGIPDNVDKCPDVPEDKDGIDDEDGCPEDDADNDGIPDAKDACPKEPGQPDPDPKKNGCPKFIHLEGSSVRVLQQVHFQTASATILPDSFPMLGEIASLLKATPAIKKMRIEGHTDNHGAADYNLDLSKRRAASVRQWLVEHGIDPGRLESQGYGITQPIETNDTDAGRAANRRVEFKITQEDTGGSRPEPPSTPAK
ncbi:MAG: OmpA family protein [Polyangiaceae bacterium]|jgi:OmpA-OmpF porin, OOP family